MLKTSLTSQESEVPPTKYQSAIGNHQIRTGDPEGFPSYKQEGEWGSLPPGNTIPNPPYQGNWGRDQEIDPTEKGVRFGRGSPKSVSGWE